MSERSPVRFFEDRVLPVLFDSLDTAFPEFAFRRRGDAWEGTLQTDQSVLDYCAVGPTGGPRIFCKRARPDRFGVAGGESWKWEAYVVGSHQPPKGPEYAKAVVRLAELVGVDHSPISQAKVTDADRQRWAAEGAQTRAKADQRRAEAEAAEHARQTAEIERAEKLVGDAVRAAYPETDDTGRTRKPLDRAPLDRYLTRRGRDESKMPGGHWPSGVLHARVEIRRRKYWAMLAPAIREGRITGCQRVFIDDLGQHIEVALYHDQPPVRKAAVGVLDGASCRLGDGHFPGGVLLLCEGVETGLALHQATGYETWPCLSTGGLRSVRIDDADLAQIRAVVVCADLDGQKPGGKFPGQDAARDAADRVRTLYHKPAAVALPTHPIAPDLVTADGIPVGKSVDWEDVANAVGDAAVKSRIDLCLAAATLETQTPAAASDPDRHPGPDHGARPRSAAGIAPERDDRFGPMHAEFDRDDPDHWAEAQRIGTLPTYTRRKKRDESGYVREPYAPVMPANDLARAHEYLLACHAPATINHAFGGGLSICVLNGERIYRHNGRRWVEQGDSPVSFLCGDIRRYFRDHCVAKQTREKPPGVNFVDANLSQNAVASIAKAVIDEINIITPRDEFQAQFLIRPNLRLDADGRPEIVADHAAHDRRLENRHAIGMPAPEDILPIRNGLLDLRCFRLDTQLVLLPHTPLFFNLGCSEIELDVEAANDALMDGETGGVEALRAYAWTLCREYHAFLSRTFKHSDDRCAPTTIRELHKVLGAVLAKSMGRYQKGLAWFVGPPGNGKSLIQSIIEAVVGPTKCVSSTVSQLDSNFHLHSWIGKDLAFFPDLDVSGRADKKKIVELLKMIAGNDAITIDRKHLSEIPNVRLGTPILISANQVPQLPDPSLALIRRSIMFAMNNPVREADRDADLGDRLRTPESLAGVLLLGLCGFKDLDDDRGFRQPQWSEGPLKDLESQLSIYHEFVEGFIEIIDAPDNPDDHWLAIGEIYRAFKLYLEAEGRDYKPDSGTMMSQLKALLIQRGWVPSKKTSKNAANGYTGLRLTEHANDVIRQGDTNSHGGSHVGSNAGGHDDHGFLPPV